MPELSQIERDGIVYDVKDQIARGTLSKKVTTPETAKPGDILRVLSVSQEGVPTKFEAISIPSGWVTLMNEDTVEIPADTPVTSLEYDLPDEAKMFSVVSIFIKTSKPTNDNTSLKYVRVTLCGTSITPSSGAFTADNSRTTTWGIIEADLNVGRILNSYYYNAPEYNKSSGMSVFYRFDRTPVASRNNTLGITFSNEYAGTISVSVRGMREWGMIADA